MTCSTEILTVRSLSAPPGPVPDNMYVPHDPQRPRTFAALGVGSFTIFPMRFRDNRPGAVLATYGLKNEIVSQWHLPGGYEIERITVEGSGQTAHVHFWGPSSEPETRETLTMDDVYQLIAQFPVDLHNADFATLAEHFKNVLLSVGFVRADAGDLHIRKYEDFLEFQVLELHQSTWSTAPRPPLMTRDRMNAAVRTYDVEFVLGPNTVGKYPTNPAPKRVKARLLFTRMPLERRALSDSKPQPWRFESLTVTDIV